MSTSELHTRLEHLVSYSSQLIFVSNDKTNQQSNIVEAFLGQQTEHTEVAIIDAKQTTFLQDYRKQLHKQLLGTYTTSDFERPLNQLLSALNEHEGPILIIVSHAENLPQKFLQELWELVLQSRFAANKQHLNVLLFSQPEWAEQAKTWLPTHSGNKPILLNSSSILSYTGDASDQIAQTDLEQLINTKREQFAERIRGRASQYEAIQPVLRKPWLAGLIILLFISVFGGMLYWQYPEVANKWWQQLTTPQEAPFEVSIAQADVIIAITPDRSEPIEKNQDIAKKPSESPVPLAEKLVPIGPEGLVTDWKNAVKQIDNATTSRFIRSGSEQLYKSPVILRAPLPAEPSVNPVNSDFAQKTTSTLTGKAKKSDEVMQADDYEVKDLTPIAQLKLGLAQALPSSPTNAKIDEKSTLNAVTQGDQQNFNYNENTLLALPTNKYLIQVASVANTWLMQTYIEKNRLHDQLWIYKTQRDGGDWFVLLHSQAYNSLELAKNAVNSLSPALQQGTPFVKTTRQVQQEINR